MAKTDSSRQTATFYIDHVRRYPKLAIGILVLMPLTLLANSYIPQLIIATILSRLSQHHYQSHDVWHSFGPLLVAYVILIFIGAFLWRAVDYLMWKLEGRITRMLAEEVFKHMLRESADFHANNFSGSLVSGSNKLISGYVRLADTTVFMVYPLLLGLVITALILITRAPLYTLALILLSIVFIAVAFKISRPVQEANAEYAAAETRQTGYLADAIGNVMVIKSFAHNSYERQRFSRATGNSQKKLYRVAKVHNLQMNYIGIISRTMSGVALVMAVISVVNFNANIGTVFLIVSYTSSIVDQLFSFSNSSLRNYNRALGDASEMVKILAQKPSVLDPNKPEPLHIDKGTIDFKNVTFSHAGTDDAIFEDLNLSIKHGEKIGLVGHSGSGKTTFTRLLLRFSDLDGGTITIDGQDIASIKQDDLHTKIAYVPQEPALFHRSIAENIGYGNLNASDEAIRRAAKLAHASDFIDTLPDGYDTLVGERGVKLSGGQRQRVAIARALLKDAPILLLDEATSALDSESEALIQDALWKLMEGRTAVIIAHRLSTIQRMDRIIVLDNGAIIEHGSHSELIKKDGVYAGLWARQSGGFMED